MLENGVTQHAIGKDDVLEHLPIGGSVAVIDVTTAGVKSKQIMVSIPESEFRKELGIVGTHVHDAMAKAWTFIKDELAGVDAMLKKEL